MSKFLDTTGLGALRDWVLQKLGLKQDTLVSGTNIKTINNQNILGSGDLSVGGGLQNLVDGSSNGSVRGTGTTAEDSSYTIGNYAFAEGYKTKASGFESHAEGYNTKALGNYSHAEGSNTTASTANSHVEGFNATASGSTSHAEGYYTTASGNTSHAQNYYTIAAKEAQTALGTYNIEDTSTTTTHPSKTNSYGQYAVIVGNGTSGQRSNAFTVDWNGNTETHSKDFERDTGGTLNEGFRIVDKNGDVVAYMKGLSTLDSQDRTIEGFNIGTSREVNGSTIWNNLRLMIDADGNSEVNIGQPAAWRNALQIANGMVNVSVAENSYTDVVVNHGLGIIPRVVATLESSGTAVNIGNVTVTVHTRTSTTFTIRVFNNRSTALNPSVHWIAIGRS